MPHSTVSRFLFIRPGGIGDAVLLLPAIGAVKKAFPRASIDILAEKRNAAVFKLNKDINAILLYDRPFELLTVFDNVYDVVIDTEQWHRLSSVVARLTKAPMLIGFATNNRKILYTHAVCYSHSDHEISSFLHLLKPFMEISDTGAAPQGIPISSDHSILVRHYLLPLAGKRIISVFPGGSIKQKIWGKDRFRDAIKLFIQRGYGVVLVGGEEDRSDADEISKALPSVVNTCGKLSLAETSAVIRETVLLVTGDSGIMHIAGVLGTKVLALFGPSNAIKWAPRSEHSVVISPRIECSPCSQYGSLPRCKHEGACMNLITVSEVVDKALELAVD